MGSENADTFVNRDTPIPVVQIHPADDDTSAARTPNSRPGHSRHFSASKLKDKLESLTAKGGQDPSNRMGDKMFNLYVCHRSIFRKGP